MNQQLDHQSLGHDLAACATHGERDDESIDPYRDRGATTAELALWVVGGLTFVLSIVAVVTPLGATLAERIAELIG
ncbi:MAG: hypothetical protein AAFP84_07370 [Actinomycetota bacterium]